MIKMSTYAKERNKTIENAHETVRAGHERSGTLNGHERSGTLNGQGRS
jgi:hypothetical protein